jgi:hypothetical protein
MARTVTRDCLVLEPHQQRDRLDDGRTVEPPGCHAPRAYGAGRGLDEPLRAAEQHRV